MTPAPAPDYNTVPGTTEDDYMWLSDPSALSELCSLMFYAEVQKYIVKVTLVPPIIGMMKKLLSV